MASRFSRAMSSTAFRLSALFIMLFGVTAIILFIYVTSLTTRIVLGEIKESINQQVENVQVSYQRGGIPNILRYIDRQSRQPGAYLYLIADLSGRIIAGNVRAIEPGALDRPGWRGRPFEYQRYDGDDDHTFQAIAQVIRLPNNLTLLVGRDVGEPERIRLIVRNALVLTLALMAIGGILAWLLIGRRALKRLDDVSAATNSIVAGDLSRRLPVAGSGAEFDRLSEALNTLIAKLEVLNKGVRDISDNVAHDLKTPLTRMRSRADRALTQNVDKAKLREALEQNIDDSDQLIQTFNAILRISRLEAGTLLENRDAVDLSALGQDVVELFEPSAEESGATINLDIKKKVIILGNRELLAQTLFNLIENALRHGQNDGAIGKLNVSLIFDQKDKKTAQIIIADNGVGIEADERDHATERFVRLERSRSTPGTGLGLSLAKAIVEAHGGTIALEDNQPGLRININLPVGDVH